MTPWERRALVRKGTRRVIAISQVTRKNLAELYGRRDGVDVIYHGVDTVTFHPDKSSIPRRGADAELGLFPRTPASPYS